MSWTDVIEADRRLFLWINEGWSSGWLDIVLPWMRDFVNWLPLYAVMIGVCIYKYKRLGVWWSLVAMVTVGLSDILSSRLIKTLVARPRPCHVMDQLPEMILRVECGSGYSFTSSHATNHMAIAMFIIASTKLFGWGNWRWIFALWAFIIGLAQVYVGVHYPFDLIGGFLLGAGVGVMTAYLFNLMSAKWSNSTSPKVS